MSFEDQKNNTQEEIKTQEATAEAPAVKPEELSEQMAEQSQKEVADFQAEGNSEMEANEKRAAEDGLVVDENDKAELKVLDQEAVAAEKK